jgi:uncharacterized protein (DUF2141 family)
MWRKAILLAVLAAAPAADDAGPFEHVSCKGGPNEIRVTVKGVKKSVGLMTAELFRNDPEGFLNKKGRLFRVRYAAHAPVTQFCLEAPEAGQWAVVAYHDENANQKFDKGAFGLPVEPYGISRNPKMRLGPPPIEDALFDVDEGGAAVEIKLKG